MKLKTLFISLLVITLFSCNSSKKSQKEITPNEIEVTKKTIENYLISNSSAGDFKIGSEIPFPTETDIYELEKKVDTLMEEGYTYEETSYKLTQNTEFLLVLKVNSDSETGAKSEKISEIKVYSEKFKTPQGIGVDSTIDEFIAKYPTYKIWYTYVSDMYVLETEGVNAQFLLDKNDFTSELKTTSDQEFLKKSDFKSTAKIAEIRIF